VLRARGKGSKFSGHFAGLSLIRKDAQREPQRHARPVDQQAVEAMLGERAQALGLELPSLKNIAPASERAARARQILVHSGAAQPVRVWPLENYRQLVARLRKKEFHVQIACDPSQRDWWLRKGEANVATPRNVTELIALVDQAYGFIGNDSGPGHLAAIAGVPTFTLFGPQLPEWFAPVHPAAQWIEGKACPYKPCSDYCRFARPICLTDWTEPEIWARVEPFVEKLNRPD